MEQRESNEMALVFKFAMGLFRWVFGVAGFACARPKGCRELRRARR